MFNSKRFSIPLLAIPALLVNVSGNAAIVAATDPLDEVVITATRRATEVRELAVPVSVIKRDAIEASLAGDVTQLLATLPGVEIARSGGPGQTASIFMRGSESNHTAVLVDGVRINPGTIGGAPLQNIQPENIERIEVVRGARSALYGTDAIGGVVNIITRAGAARGASLLAAAGHYGTHSYAADAGTDLDPRSHLGGSIAINDSDAFAPRSGSASRGAFRDRSGNLQFQFAPSDTLSLRANGWQSRGRNDYDNFGSQGSQDFLTASYSASADWKAESDSSFSVGVNRAQDEIQQRLSPDYARTRRDVVELQGGVRAGAIQYLIAGATLSQEHTAALSFGTRFNIDTRVQQYFLQDQIDTAAAGNLLLAYGHTHHETFGTHDSWNAEYGYQLASVHLSAAAGTAFHAPDSTDRFGFGGNPNLKPEISKQWDLGLRWQAAAGQTLSLNAYENRISDLVDYVITNFITFDGSNQNVDRARIRGLEAVYEVTREHWTLQANGNWQDPRNLIDQSLLLRRARQHFALDAQQHRGAFAIGAELQYEGRRADAGFPSNVELPGYALLTLTSSWQITPGWSIQARLDNALDRRYEEIRGYNTARRGITLATRWRMR
jgi:vitamin B12 transporter